ncbi:hypothetical protein K505DRAFT_372961 [Melanomma pulvis-pyrius CBS 109.77]|uniref:Rhodopsin domain-containing protein n=1 Tax=Melanomma pulvis-pyrius CBS 109.77 TaxID=1314802 RepID=A0A6A6XK07_9PLEO|nr:hypothetical protein K505DRAFT_372961 [Melanomma pulvis-pyrius CBS 109.77]
MQSPASGLAIESWTLYGIGIGLVVSRIILRLVTFRSIFKLQADDWLMICVLIPFTGTVVCANQLVIPLKSPIHGVGDMIWASKIRLALEPCQITTTWLVKACLLILYWRIFPITTSRKERRYLAWVSAYCIFSYLAIQVLMVFWCHPVRNYWNPFPKDPQCSTYHNHSIATLSFNLTTTLAVLVLPIPFIPTPRKFLLAILFVLGVVVLVAGILGRYYVIVHPTSSTYLAWYTAEAAVILLFANLPFLSSLVTSTTTSRLRHLSSNLSLSQWPRSYKDTPPLRAQRLSSTTTTISTMSPIEATEMWSNSGALPLTPPPTPVQTLRLTDPPPELEVYWSARRPSTRDSDVEKMFTEPRWPLH